MLPGTLMDKEQGSVRMAFRWIIFFGRDRTVWPEDEEVSLVHRFLLENFLYNILFSSSILENRLFTEAWYM